jgi:signal peptide peptidase SppA
MSDLWAVTPSVFNRLRTFDLSAHSGPLPEAAGKPRERKERSIAVLSLHGVLEPRTSLMGWLFGNSTSTMAFAQAFKAAVADDKVSGILLDIDSPGGRVTGTMELGDLIYAARGTKPIVAIANHQADSAAYWAGTAADRLYVSPSGRVGSVGTLAVHTDISAAYEKWGFKDYVVASDDSPYKGEWLESQPANAEYLADLQAMVNESQKHFTAAVARNRGVSLDDVRKNFGKGRDVSAQYAIAHGMADGIATFDDVLSRMVEGRMKFRRGETALRSARLAMAKSKLCS